MKLRKVVKAQYHIKLERGLILLGLSICIIGCLFQCYQITEVYATYGILTETQIGSVLKRTDIHNPILCFGVVGILVKWEFPRQVLYEYHCGSM